jgi:hypothetical protein
MSEMNSEDWLKDLPLQSENIGFRAEEMLRCAKCARTNPPTRRKCFYCGAELEISETQSQFLKPNVRTLEAWEKAFNLILKPTKTDFDETQISEIAKGLKIGRELLRKIIESGKPLPVARVESEKEAEIGRSFLRQFDIDSVILSDETMNYEKVPRRLRRIEFDDDKLIFILFNQDEIVEIANEDIALIVTGAIFERKIEATEKRQRKGENKILETTEIASDESLIDIYSRHDQTGFRVMATGFDFSCLEADKGILANENIKRLAGKLVRVAPNAKIINDYLKIRELLAKIWEVEQKTGSQGLKRESFRKFNLENVTTVSNLTQFTKYSRLQRHLI